MTRVTRTQTAVYVALVALIIIFIGASIPIGDAFPAWSSSSPPAGVSAPYH